MALQGLFHNGVHILPHDRYIDPFVGVPGAHPLDCSTPAAQLQPAIWELRTDLKGLWCTPTTHFGPQVRRWVPCTALCVQVPARAQQRHVSCHGISAAPWPLPDPNSIVAIEASGVRVAGHVDRTTAQQASCSRETLLLLLLQQRQKTAADCLCVACRRWPTAGCGACWVKGTPYPNARCLG